jgi:hypothetical protein
LRLNLVSDNSQSTACSSQKVVDSTRITQPLVIRQSFEQFLANIDIDANISDSLHTHLLGDPNSAWRLLITLRLSQIDEILSKQRGENEFFLCQRVARFHIFSSVNFSRLLKGAEEENLIRKRWGDGGEKSGKKPAV